MNSYWTLFKLLFLFDESFFNPFQLFVHNYEKWITSHKINYHLPFKQVFSQLSTSSCSVKISLSNFGLWNHTIIEDKVYCYNHLQKPIIILFRNKYLAHNNENVLTFDTISLPYFETWPLPAFNDLPSSLTISLSNLGLHVEDLC